MVNLSSGTKYILILVACIVVLLFLLKTSGANERILSYFSKNFIRTNSSQSFGHQNPVVQSQNNQPPKLNSTPSGTYRLYPQKIGQPFEVSGLQYAIESAADLGSDLSKTKKGGYGKSEGGSFIVIKFNVKNLGLDTVVARDVVIYLRDSSGRVYKPDPPLSGATYFEFDYEFFDVFTYNPPSVKPGFSRKFYTLIEVASDSRGLSIVIANQKDQNFFIPLGL